MVVDSPLPPILRLLAEDIPLLVERMIFGSPEDAARVRALRFQEAIDDAVVAAECRRVVVPMNRHRQSIGGE